MDWPLMININKSIIKKIIKWCNSIFWVHKNTIQFQQTHSLQASTGRVLAWSLEWSRVSTEERVSGRYKSRTGNLIPANIELQPCQFSFDTIIMRTCYIITRQSGEKWSFVQGYDKAQEKFEKWKTIHLPLNRIDIILNV